MVDDKIHIRVRMYGIDLSLEADSSREIRDKITYGVFRHFLRSQNKSEAVLNTSVLTDMSERTIWKVISEQERQGRPHPKTTINYEE